MSTRALLAGLAGMMSMLAVPPALADDMAPGGHDWSGVYFGINGGYGLGRHKQMDATEDSPGNADLRGGVLGGQIGYNMMRGAIMLGFETDMQATQMHGGYPNSDTFECIPCTLDVGWVGTARLRLGYSYGPLLPYVTGGLSYASVHAMQYRLPDYRYKDTLLGLTAGAGLEYAVTDHVSGRLEYLYVDPGSTEHFGSGELSASAHFNLLRAGLNYHF